MSKLYVKSTESISYNTVCYAQDGYISTLLQQPYPTRGPDQTWLPQQTLFRTVEL